MKSQSKVLTLLVPGALVLAAAIFVLSRFSIDLAKSTSDSQISGAISPERLNDPENQKTYRSEESGFEFQYPSDLVLLDRIFDEYGTPSVGLRSKEMQQQVVDNKFPGSIYSFEFRVSVYPNLREYDCIETSCLVEWNEYQGDLVKYIASRSTTDFGEIERLPDISGQAAYGVREGGFSSNYAVFISGEDIPLYVLQFGTADDQSALSRAQQQVLSTFSLHH